jgi:hypothetical protein
MMCERRSSVDARTVTVRVPIAIRRRGGRKLVVVARLIDVRDDTIIARF